MRVLFLTRYPKSGASSRYRVYQYVPHLKALGISCTVSSFMSEAMYRTTFRRGKTLTKVLHTAWAVIRRGSWLLRINRFDVVVLQRECLPFGAPWMEQYIAARKPTIFDYDDALFIHKSSKVNPVTSWLRKPEKYVEIFKNADCVLAGNQWLADIASKYCTMSLVFHVAEDTERIPKRLPQNKGPCVILGWLGSQSTEKYLELIREPLEILAQRYSGIRLKVIGGGYFSSNVIPIDHVPWSLETEVDELCSLDIGLMPLPMEEWSKGKSGGKARTYMAAGVPPVVSSIGYNIELIKDKSLGRLVTTTDEWCSVLDELINDHKLRQQIGDSARRHVMKHFSLPGQTAKLARILQDVKKKRTTHEYASSTR